MLHYLTIFSPNSQIDPLGPNSHIDSLNHLCSNSHIDLLSLSLMGSPQPWPPYPALKDCSQGYCSYYCPQWCYFLFPPPSPSPPSKHTLSPLLIAVISMLSTAFLLTAYYVILSKFRRRFQSSPPSAFRSPLASAQNDTPSVSQGLDETLINKIASCQYRPSEGLVADGTDCSVCLGQFEDGERLRLLPQCDHAFHLRCIDTWLRAHSNCPLCRASIVVSAVPPTPNPEPNRIVEGTPPVVVVESESTSPDTIEIREEGSRFFGRSFSMDSPFRRQVLTGASSGGSSRWNRALHCVMSPVRMKRSLSGYTRQIGRGRSAVLPI